MRLITAHRLLIGAAMAAGLLYGAWALAAFVRGGDGWHLFGALAAGASVVILGIYYKVYVRRLVAGRGRS